MQFLTRINKLFTIQLQFLHFKMYFQMASRTRYATVPTIDNINRETHPWVT